MQREKERKFRERDREKRDFWKEMNASLCITLDVQCT